MLLNSKLLEVEIKRWEWSFYFPNPSHSSPLQFTDLQATTCLSYHGDGDGKASNSILTSNLAFTPNQT